MSEYSDACYLLDVTGQEAKVFLRKVGSYSLLGATTGRWTMALVEGSYEAHAPLGAFVDAVEPIWLHYSFAEDHGLDLRLFAQGALAAHVFLQRRGPSDVAIEPTIGVFRRLGIVDDDHALLLAALLERAREPEVIDPSEVRRLLGEALGIELAEHTSSADLTYLSPKALARRHPGAELVLKSKRGKARTQGPPPEPNRFCPRPGFPALMYLPVPDGEADPEELARHLDHWLTTNDFDDEAQEGFWLYTAYTTALPTRYRYLADRVMNLHRAFDDYEAALRDTLRAIVAVTDDDFDWTPYLERQKGGQRL